MMTFTSRQMLLASVGILVSAVFAVGAAVAAGAAAQSASPPDFSSGQTAWQTGNGGAFTAVAGTPGPMTNDPAHPFVPNGRGIQPTFRIADLSTPNLKQWAKDIMKKDNDEVLAGKIAYTPGSSCKPAGIPAFLLAGGPFYFVQSPKEVVIIMQGDHQVRHVYMGVPHSANVKPSWYGESVGRYEGDTLVIDTIGQSTKTFVDNYRTPHTEKLHVVERWRMIDDGKGIEVHVTVDDPDTYNQPWQATRQFRRVQGTLQESACAESNLNFGLFDYHIPVAEKPDF
jgi:hypothetical protein